MEAEIQALRQAFDNLDKVTIGLFRPYRGNPQKDCYRVVESKDGLIKCIALGNITFHTYHTSVDRGKLLMFEKNLSEALKSDTIFPNLLLLNED
jgi:hypothetical protein